MVDNDVVGLVEFADGVSFTAMLYRSPEAVSYLKDRHIDFLYYFNGLEAGSYRFIKVILVAGDTGASGQAADKTDEQEPKRSVSLYADFVIQ